jgi:hypothetical protein
VANKHSIRIYYRDFFDNLIGNNGPSQQNEHEKFISEYVVKKGNVIQLINSSGAAYGAVIKDSKSEKGYKIKSV